MHDNEDIPWAPAYDDGSSGSLRIPMTLHPLGMRLEGELDRGGVPAVTAALTSLARRAARGDGVFHVDLSGLDFVDVSGLRVLVAAGFGAGGGGAGVIRVAAVSAAARRLLKLTGWDTMPGWGEAPGDDRMSATAARTRHVRPGAGEHRSIPAASDTVAQDDGG
ncbi:STAS domain-containing protein [Sphaerisporangium sp. TRM90804]|uniref:STAS domain-containing protein n=1 Tax=Sphaerisporangium sp. TRM90804 TaxID=3031113 RepID=UPI002448BE3F|nr:STAS domain-containing protein [Sphaerisporangium sp. TRM90804]MDH2424229.1 STAS domain-containing protein [Sphaerisporangium sp. TRM90804]